MMQPASMASVFVKELLEIVDEPRATPEHPVIQTVEHQVATRLVLGQRPREHPLVFRFERLDDVESRPKVCVKVEEKWCWPLRTKSAHGTDEGPFQDETLPDPVPPTRMIRFGTKRSSSVYRESRPARLARTDRQATSTRGSVPSANRRRRTYCSRRRICSISRISSPRCRFKSPSKLTCDPSVNQG